MTKVSRRKVFGAFGAAAGGLMTGNFVGAQAASAPPDVEPAPDWDYHLLDPDEVADRAYAQYPGNGCMYAVFKGILDPLGERHGEPYASFPVGMMKYGHGGVGGYGCICGAANGAASVIGLFRRQKRERDLLITELLKWYETTALPHYQPAIAEPAEPMAKSTAGSVLCHASIANWCRQSNVDPYDPRRGERCRRLSADVAAQAVRLLNRAQTKGVPELTLTDSSAQCMKCHAEPGHREMTIKAKMNCGSCHDLGDDHAPEWPQP